MFATLRRSLPAAALLVIAAAPVLHAQQFRARTDRVLATSPAGAVILVSDTVGIMAPVHQYAHAVNTTSGPRQRMAIGAVRQLRVRGDVASVVAATRLELTDERGKRTVEKRDSEFTLQYREEGWQLVSPVAAKPDASR